MRFMELTTVYNYTLNSKELWNQSFANECGTCSPQRGKWLIFELSFSGKHFILNVLNNN